MDSFYDLNGLIFWSQKECMLREMMQTYFVDQIEKTLRETNRAWSFMRVEAPLLTPRDLVNAQYTEDDVYFLNDLALRPETTPGTFRYIRRLFDDCNSGVVPPVCVWQAGKSFRKEQDQPTKFVRLKEFYQLEFQCVFTSDTLNDYHSALLKPAAQMISDMVRLPTSVVESDRLPVYSRKTMDVEVTLPDDRQMELASISLRTDFPGKVQFTAKNKVVEKDLLVAEVAIGLDRCVYSFLRK